MIDELRWRGLLADATEHAQTALTDGKVTGYIGFDPTASSLHVGSLVPIMGLVHLQRAGHCPIALVGGGTGLIGDPSGKSSERALLDRAQAEANAEGIHRQLAAFLDFESRTAPARMANNLDWLGDLGLVDFLRDTGKHFAVNAMLRKESVRRRIADEDSGISFTEFSYQLLQAYDFLELNRRYGCTLQMGGSDQWGNITAGIDLVRRMGGPRCHGVVFPLVESSRGVKFGKTEEGTVWLDPERTSPYRFYQFWLNTEDGDVIRYLKMFTLLDRPTIDELAQAVADRPHARETQRRLASEMTRTVHGAEGLDRAERASRVLFGGSVEGGLGAADIAAIRADVPSHAVARTELVGKAELPGLMAKAELTVSRNEGRRLIRGGGVYLNGERVLDERAVVRDSDLIEDRFALVRIGKKRYLVVEAV
ncbi:MAG: tyrosine--tRNA ligase [Gemmatimonadota bacterium]|nr:tyrosine--tRNA ligase [Gemmatimonadota bacterium]MDE2864923.1 tyrosine--tRNA ligase [Gemmatimonadota bacterium]